MHIKSFYTQQHCCVSLKTLYPGGIRTQVFLFLRQMRCPLRHSARALSILFIASVSVDIFMRATSVLNDFCHVKLHTRRLPHQGCQIFLGKIYQYGKIYTKLPQNIPNSRKIYWMAINGPNSHKIYQHLPLQDPPKFIKIAMFGLKIYHLATLFHTWSRSESNFSYICTKMEKLFNEPIFNIRRIESSISEHSVLQLKWLKIKSFSQHSEHCGVAHWHRSNNRRSTLRIPPEFFGLYVPKYCNVVVGNLIRIKYKIN
jgi:hypothetical protein